MLNVAKQLLMLDVIMHSVFMISVLAPVQLVDNLLRTASWWVWIQLPLAIVENCGKTEISRPCTRALSGCKIHESSLILHSSGGITTFGIMTFIIVTLRHYNNNRQKHWLSLYWGSLYWISHFCIVMLICHGRDWWKMMKKLPIAEQNSMRSQFKWDQIYFESLIYLLFNERVWDFINFGLKSL